MKQDCILYFQLYKNIAQNTSFVMYSTFHLESKFLSNSSNKIIADAI